MDKWNILSVFLMAVALFEVSGKQLVMLEQPEKGFVDLTTPLYNFWLTVNLASIALGLSMLHKLRELSVTVDLSMEHTKGHKEKKMKFREALRKFLRNVKAASGPATVATMAVSVIILAYLLPIGLLAIADANVTGWVAVVVTMFQTVLPILIIVGLALKYVPRR